MYQKMYNIILLLFWPADIIKNKHYCHKYDIPASGLPVTMTAPTLWPITRRHLLPYFRTCQAVIGWHQQSRLKVTEFAVHPVSVREQRDKDGDYSRCSCFCQIVVVSAAVVQMWRKRVGAQPCDLRLSGQTAQHQTQRPPAFPRCQIWLR